MPTGTDGRGAELLNTFEAQIDRLTAAVTAIEINPNAARLPCPGREKLGDGTIGTVVQHTAANYTRIAAFLTGSATSEGKKRGLLAKLTGRSSEHGAHRHGPGRHRPARPLDPAGLLAQLNIARESLIVLADTAGPDLHTVPAEGSFRFCDGERTLDQVLAGLLTHQAHQLDAINDAITQPMN